MDKNAQPQPQRIRLNPYLAECPDFSDGFHDELITTLIQPDRTREQVIENFRTAWHAQNNRRKELWDTQACADREVENARNGQGVDRADPARANEDEDPNRRKPKLGTFVQDAHVGNEITLKPSIFAINKLRDMKYVELYCFTPAGCRDHANLRTSTADEAFGFSYGFSTDGTASSALTLKPISALAHPGKINPDGHPFIHSSEGKQALTWYQAHVREDWHRKLGTTESFNLSILNDMLLAAFKKKADDVSVQN